jgi:hypothetical protein
MMPSNLYDMLPLHVLLCMCVLPGLAGNARVGDLKLEYTALRSKPP